MAKRKSITLKTGNNMASTITFTPKDNLKQIFDEALQEYNNSKKKAE